jgi:hypothetical protein
MLLMRIGKSLCMSARAPKDHCPRAEVVAIALGDGHLEGLVLAELVQLNLLLDDRQIGQTVVAVASSLWPPT